MSVSVITSEAFIFEAIRTPRAKGRSAGALSPPINLAPHWLGAHAPYTLSKYAMTILTCGLAAQDHPARFSADCLWPRTTIATDAVQNIVGGDAAMAVSRKPQIMADAAYAIPTRPAGALTGQTLIDDEVLTTTDVSDLASYRYGDSTQAQLKIDLFREGAEE